MITSSILNSPVPSKVSAVKMGCSSDQATNLCVKLHQCRISTWRCWGNLLCHHEWMLENVLITTLALKCIGVKNAGVAKPLDWNLNEKAEKLPFCPSEGPVIRVNHSSFALLTFPHKQLSFIPFLLPSAASGSALWDCHAFIFPSLSSHPVSFLSSLSEKSWPMQSLKLCHLTRSLIELLSAGRVHRALTVCTIS